MGRRQLILDTNVLIDFDRGVFHVDDLADDELSIAALTVAEFRAGIEASPGSARAERRAQVLATTISFVEVLDYTRTTASHHARLMAHTRRTGAPRRPHDLILAAHAAETGRILVSSDARARFGDLPGVSVLQP